jgi:hypothetical protein
MPTRSGERLRDLNQQKLRLRRRKSVRSMPTRSGERLRDLNQQKLRLRRR